MFELSSEPWRRSWTRCFLHLFHKCYLQPPQHSPVINVTKNDISSFSITLIFIQLLVCNDPEFFSQSLFSIPWTLLTFFVLTYNIPLCMNSQTLSSDLHNYV